MLRVQANAQMLQAAGASDQLQRSLERFVRSPAGAEAEAEAVAGGQAAVGAAAEVAAGAAEAAATASPDGVSKAAEENAEGRSATAEAERGVNKTDAAPAVAGEAGGALRDTPAGTPAPGTPDVPAPAQEQLEGGGFAPTQEQLELEAQSEAIAAPLLGSNGEDRSAALPRCVRGPARVLRVPPDQSFANSSNWFHATCHRK